MQQANPGWLVFHNSETGIWSAYRRTLPGRRETESGVPLLIRADSAEELEGKPATQTGVRTENQAVLSVSVPLADPAALHGAGA
ncbi:hypothetical protein AB0395_31335 [Streptosporangium sp. NPDC051023]|uniref:hypothetical protein n=1 Tax=Streptosporangium sp. NPDC051023 TaxID=3155410 RepID=UPI00344E07EB